MTDLFKLHPASSPEREAALMERALVFVGASGERTFLAGYGFGIESDRDAYSDPEEYGVVLAAPNEPGLWRWDGKPLWTEERSEGVLEGCVPDYTDGTGKPFGTWRRLTAEEAARIAAGDLADFTETEENFRVRHDG